MHINVKDEDNATIILSKDKDAWGSYFYDDANDALRAGVKLKDNAHTELLTYEFNEVETNSTTVYLAWEKKAIPFNIEVDVTKIVLDDIRGQFKGQTGFTRQNWEQAANFSMNNGGDLEEALDWINSALEGQFFSQKTVNGLAIKAQILQKKGDLEGYGKTMDDAVAMANPSQINRMGYAMITAKDYDRAVKYFSINVKSNPKNANWHNSLGEAYKAKGDKKNAIKHFKKSLTMNPSANVKANSEKNLKELGAL